MVPAFVKLLKDTEAEVRTAIAGQIPGMSHVDHSRGFPVYLCDAQVSVL